MRQRRPVGAANIAMLHGPPPQGLHLVRRLGLVEAVDRNAMTAVERFVQPLGAIVSAAGGPHPGRMHLMLGRGGDVATAELAERVPQFGGRQAGADDRAMQVGSNSQIFRRVWVAGARMIFWTLSANSRSLSGAGDRRSNRN